LGKIKSKKVLITPLKRIKVANGDVLHALKKTDLGFSDFGEAYFSCIEENQIKAWKRHKLMTLNLIVPFGRVKFVFTEDGKYFDSYTVGEDNYCRITVAPQIWFGFQNQFRSTSIILNIADIIHDENEVEKKNISIFNYFISKN